MNKKSLIDKVCSKHSVKDKKQVAEVVENVLNVLVDAISNKEEIKINGAFKISYSNRLPRTVQNPRNKDQILNIGPKVVIKFKVTDEIKNHLNNLVK